MKKGPNRLERFAPTAGERLTLAICASLLIALTVFTGTAAAYASGAGGAGGFPGGGGIVEGGALFALALVTAYFAFIVFEEALAAFRLSIAIGDDRLVLDLPKRRGTARLPAVVFDGRPDAIQSIESRHEAFTFLGLTLIQQAYRLTLHDGEAIVLGADRPLKAPFFAGAVMALAKRRGITVKSFGLVDGAFGIPVLVGPKVPDWSTPSLDTATIEARWRGVARAMRLAQLANKL